MAPRHRSVATRLSPALIDLVQRRDVSIIGLLPARRLLAGGCFWNYDPPARALPIPAGHVAIARMCNAKAAMRDPETIETELMEISAIPDDLVKLERIIAWCASHPDEVPFALHQLMKVREKQPPQTAHPANGPDQS